MHVGADPEDPHAEGAEERQAEGHHAVVRGLRSVLGPREDVLPEDASSDDRCPQEYKCARPKTLFLSSHFVCRIQLLFINCILLTSY